MESGKHRRDIRKLSGNRLLFGSSGLYVYSHVEVLRANVKECPMGGGGGGWRTPQ